MLVMHIFVDTDSAWKFSSITEMTWFVLYTVCLLAMSLVLRPREGFRELAEVDELLDETLTEVGNNNSIRVGTRDFNDIEMEDRSSAQMQNLGRRDKTGADSPGG